jgi:hypothetical protein
MMNFAVWSAKRFGRVEPMMRAKLSMGRCLAS